MCTTDNENVGLSPMIFLPNDLSVPNDLSKKAGLALGFWFYAFRGFIQPPTAAR